MELVLIRKKYIWNDTCYKVYIYRIMTVYIILEVFTYVTDVMFVYYKKQKKKKKNSLEWFTI